MKLAPFTHCPICNNLLPDPIDGNSICSNMHFKQYTIFDVVVSLTINSPKFDIFAYPPINQTIVYNKNTSTTLAEIQSTNFDFSNIPLLEEKILTYITFS